MKKMLFALMALCAIAISFTSCGDGMADPVTEPVAGHQYYNEDENGYIELQFHNDHSLTLVVRTELVNQSNDMLIWSMKNPKVEVKAAPGTNMAGKVVFSGTYNADDHTLTMTEETTGVTATYRERGYSY